MPAAQELAAAAAALNAGSKVTILAGAGCRDAHDELVEFARVLHAPVVHTMRGKEFVEHDNPYDVGMTGLLGFSSGYRAMQRCDTLLMLGTDFPYQQFLPDDAATIQVDIRGSQLGRRTKVDIGLVGGVKETIDALLPQLTPNRSSKHLDAMLKHYQRDPARSWTTSPRRAGVRRPIHPQYLVRLIDEAADDDAVLIPDVGSPVIWAARYLRMNGKRRLIGSFNHGSMANALPQAIGAQATYPGRQVVALAGDGGLTMLMGELLTLTQMHLPVKVVVFNNSSLNFVELEMKSAGFVNFGTDLENPDFAAVGHALGMKGWRVEQSKDLPRAVQEFLTHDGPALLDVVTERQELSIPPTITAEQAKGFALFAIRTVLSGRGTELIDLARTNIRQDRLTHRSSATHDRHDTATFRTRELLAASDFRRRRGPGRGGAGGHPARRDVGDGDRLQDREKVGRAGQSRHSGRPAPGRRPRGVRHHRQRCLPHRGSLVAVGEAGLFGPSDTERHVGRRSRIGMVCQVASSDRVAATASSTLACARRSAISPTMLRKAFSVSG